MDTFLAEIRIFPCNFAPLGWALCNGQLLPISQNTALFSLLGTTYGGNGTSNFALPDMQGTVPLHFGQGSGLSERVRGETSGTDSVTLLQTELPAHNHLLRAHSEDPGDVQLPSAGSVFAGSVGGKVYQPAATSGVTLAPQALSPTGGSQPHNNLQPYLTLNFCIALQGIYPQRP